MAARAMWKAKLAIGRHRVGVRMYAAVENRDVHFHLLHEPDGARVQQRMAEAGSGDTVGSADVRRGVEVERGRFVVLDDDELAALEPKPSRDIELLRFLPAAAIDHRWYERPYYLGPDAGDVDGYFALVAALQQTGREGLARWSLRKREYLGALRVHDGYLALVSLRHADEVVVASDLPAPEGRALDQKERQLAGQLIDALAGEFRHDDWRDEYRDRVLELVAQKQKGKQVKLKRYRPAKTADSSLVAALQRSLKSAG